MVPASALRSAIRGAAFPPLGRVFDRFERGDEGRGDGGFGLGLAITRELVAAHGGVISITSEETVGTTVTVDLPAPGYDA